MDNDIKEIISNPYVTVKEIALLAQCGLTKAYRIKKSVTNELNSKGIKVIDRRFISTLDILIFLGNPTYLSYYKQLVGDIDRE